MKKVLAYGALVAVTGCTSHFRRDRAAFSQECAGDIDRPRPPALVVGLADPVEKRDQVVDVIVAEVLFGLEAAVLIVELSTN